MRVFLTGGSGFVGRHLVAALEREGIETLALSRHLQQSDPSSIVRWLRGKLEDLGALEAELIAFRPDVCIHLAWYVEHGAYLESEQNLVAQRYSTELLGLVHRAGCRRMIGVGTCFEYRFVAGPIKETDALDPKTLYARSKAAFAAEAQRYARSSGSMSFAWARLFYLYGPGEDRRRLVPHILDHLRRRERCALSDGSAKRDYLHVEDVAEALLALARSSLVGPVNIATGQGVTVREIAEEAARQLDGLALLGFGDLPSRPSDPPEIVGANERLLQTGWRQRISLTEGMRREIAAA